MITTTPKRLFLLALALLVPGILFVGWWGWTGLAEKLRVEKLEILRAEEMGAYRVTKGLGDELFHLENSVRQGLSRAAGGPEVRWPEAAVPVLEAYRDLAHYPDLFQEAYWVKSVGPGALHWYRWSPEGWTGSEIPGWFTGSQAVVDRSPDPMVSLDSPWFTFVLPPADGLGQALVVRYNLSTVFGEIVPALAKKEFGPAGKSPVYGVSVVREVLSQFPGSGGPDLTVPLVGQIKLSSWLRNYLSGGDGSAPDLPGPGPQWGLAVKYLPDGLDSHIRDVELKNFLGAAGLTAVLAGGAALAFFSVLMRLRASRREQTFAAVVCHELKSPLAAIRALAENLSAGIVDDKDRVKDYGARIEEQSLRLEELVGNLWSLSRGDGRPGGTVPGPVDLDALAQVAASRVGVPVTRDDPGPWVAWGAAAAVRSSLDNLVTNAFKYGVREGQVPEVFLGLHRRVRWGHRWLGVSVTDHGETKRFRRRLRDRRSAGFGGGIGLVLVRDSQRHLQGRTEVRSVPGGGLSFTLWLREGPRQ